MNQTTAARLSGVSKSTVSRVIRKERNISLKLAIQLEEGTGVHRHVWMEGKQADIVAALAAVIENE